MTATLAEAIEWAEKRRDLDAAGGITDRRWNPLIAAARELQQVRAERDAAIKERDSYRQDAEYLRTVIRIATNCRYAKQCPGCTERFATALSTPTPAQKEGKV